MPLPAGYLTPASASRVLAAKKGLGSGEVDVAALVDRGYAIIGSADTVRQRLTEYQRELGFGTFSGIVQFGSLPHEDFLASVGRFAEEVMPALRPLGVAEPVA